jgi:membrane fusion protein, multidrug efflux system
VAPVFVTERALPGLRVGQPAWVRTAGIGTQVVAGRILRISPVVDAQSGTVRVTIALQSREGLRPGMFANVQVVLDTHENVLVVPKRALVFEEDRPHAFVVADGRAEKRALELGYQDTDRAEVVRGLVEGDSVVLVGQSALKDGSLVEVRNGSRPQGGEAAGAAPAAGATAP